MRQTAVEWLVETITKKHDKDFSTFYGAEIEQAKEMERGLVQLYVLYCLTSIKENLPVIRFEDFIKLEGGEK
jgi:hypothetical protein